MNHPDDGRLQSLADGELTEAERADMEKHLDVCPPCLARLRTLEGERLLVGRVLEADGPSPERQQAARRTVIERAAANARAASRPWWRGNLARAAGLVLALAGAASAAIPTSPLRVWLQERLAQPAPPAPESGPLTVTPPPVVPEPVAEVTEAGIQVGSVDAVLTVSITGIAPGGHLEVLLVDGQQSGVYAPEGSRFATTPGGLQADVDGEYVRVELSRTQPTATVEVDGALYLRKVGDRLELPGPGKDSTEARFRFQVPSKAGPSR